VLAIGILFLGRFFLIPLAFAVLLSMLMAPVCKYFDQHGLHRALSVLICVFMLFISLAIIAGIIGLQLVSFAEDITQIKERSYQLFENIQVWAEQRFNISPEKLGSYLKEQLDVAEESLGGVITGFFTSMAGLITGVVLTLVYTFLLLYHKERYELFFLKMFTHEDGGEVRKQLDKIGSVSQHYLRGRTISILLLSVLYTGGLLLVGVKHAILLGCIAALLTIIPYVGTLLGSIFPFAMALVTESSWEPALWVAGHMLVVQAVDNYFIEPYIIGGEVNLSALATILALVAGGLIWGIPGMILFIPMLGIAKIVFDNVEKLKPIGFLIGDPAKTGRRRRNVERKKKR
jgi:predicted PurR-regulated permease PerM